MFSWIRRPPVLEDNWLVQVEREQLLEINGRLAMIAGASTVANLGYVVTRDYEEPGPYAAYALVFAVSQDRNVLEEQSRAAVAATKMSDDVVWDCIRHGHCSFMAKEKIVTVPRKKTQRYIKREDYALTAAQIDNCVQSELLERLNKGLYGEIYNYDEPKFLDILATIGNTEELSEGKDEYVIADDLEPEMDDLEDFEGLLNNRLGDTYESETENGQVPIQDQSLGKDPGRL
ncbi:hypothetical protein PR202_ga01640 [Eleusine coracana subsp. coracana]|uniref:Uncharacterized protein n=1 Tax=Eleusine coracana subsp. coracana TaxID=191504 RepID=A0AAV5BJM9_ELECO|nr:hypothetical protein PR202_ga00953 [Eleusine coracana subsp. coracana]GJM85838.1 hypothetical protein PR202_ga01640 [Eleusine coracana subsp. coracana]